MSTVSRGESGAKINFEGYRTHCLVSSEFSMEAHSVLRYVEKVLAAKVAQYLEGRDAESGSELNLAVYWDRGRLSCFLHRTPQISFLLQHLRPSPKKVSISSKGR